MLELTRAFPQRILAEKRRVKRKVLESSFTSPDVEPLDSAIKRINHYPPDKYHAETNCFIHWGVIALFTF